MQKLIIMQGVPGSGKSTRARWIAAQDERAVVVSTDDQVFDANGNYDFNPKLHGQRHQRTQHKAALLLRLGVSVIVDNTNIYNHEAKPYVQVAVELGIPVEFVRCAGGFRSTHDVPDEVVSKMQANMQDLSVEAALASVSPWDKPKPLVRGQVVQLVGHPFYKHAIVCPENRHGCICVTETVSGRIASVRRQEIHKIFEGESFEVPADLIKAFADWDDSVTKQSDVNGPPPFAMTTTDEYPVRYVTNDHPSKWVVNNKPEKSGGNEWAVLAHPIRNRHMPEFSDGIYLNLTSYQGKHLVLECYAVAPNTSRSVLSESKNYKYEDSAQALVDGWEWFKKIKPWCESCLI